MRPALFGISAALALLAACGGSKTDEASKAQAKAGSAAAASAASNGMAMLAATPSREQALKVMHERHEGMETIGKTTKAIKRELDRGSPDVASLRAGAAQIADLSRKASGWFPAGTGPDLGKTGAKPEIWQNPQDFAAKLHSFQTAAKAFNVAAMSGEVGPIKAKFGDLGRTCKACHDKYRSEMHH